MTRNARLPLTTEPVMPPQQPPDHAAITASRLFAAGQDDLFIVRAIRTTAAWLPPIVRSTG